MGSEASPESEKVLALEAESPAQPWENYSLCLGFLICVMGIFIIATTLHGCCLIR